MSHTKENLKLGLGWCSPATEKKVSRLHAGTTSSWEDFLPVSNQRQILEACDLIFLSSDAQKGAGDLGVLRNGCRSNSLRQCLVGFGIGRLDETSHKRLGGPRCRRTCCPRGDINGVYDSFNAVCKYHVSQNLGTNSTLSTSRELTLLDNCHSVLKGLLRFGTWANGANGYDARDLVLYCDFAADDPSHRGADDDGPVECFAQALQKSNSILSNLMKVVRLSVVG